MSRIYSNTCRIKFTDISEKYKVNKSVKGKLSELHALLITYVSSNFRDTKHYKQMVVDALNLITYAVYADEPLPFSWSPNHPFDNLPEMDKDLIEETLGDIFLTVDGIQWDVKPTFIDNDDTQEREKLNQVSSTEAKKVSMALNSYKPSERITSANNDTIVSPTNKQDLYIQPPSIPQFDYSKIWMSGISGADQLVIYTTLPEIPTKQNEISCTTDVTKMRYSELCKLYPNQIIHTRSSIMYEKCEGIELDEDLGLILPISGYSKSQIVDNIIKYPHLFKLVRLVDGKFVSFYSNIEIDGQLHHTLDVWDSLPESKVIPKQTEFVKEYVVRRYLLERDVDKVKHKYPLFGTLDPFLTLFMPPTDYIKRGYKDVEELAKLCVISRVSYKQSRNPVIRRLTENAELHI